MTDPRSDGHESTRGSRAGAVLVLTALLAITAVPAMLGISGPGVLVGLGLAVGVAAWRARGFGAGLRWLGFTAPPSWAKVLRRSIAIGAGLQLFSVAILDPLLERLTGEAVDLSNFDSLRGDPALLLTWLAIVWLFVVWVEEIVFRGFLVRELSLALPGARSESAYVLLSAVAFGLVHWYQGISGVLSTGIVGGALALCYLRSGWNLWMPVLTHGFINTVGLGLIYLGWDRWFSALWH